MVKFLLLISFTIFNSSMLQGQGRFGCPVKENKAIIERPDKVDAGLPSKALVIKCSQCSVYSSSNGVIANIDTIDKKVVVDIAFNDYVFSYYNLSSSFYSERQKIKKGQKLGVLLRNEDLKLIITKNNNIITAVSIINCK